jgi:hypothetical protein
VPVAVVLSVEFSIIVSSLVNDVRSASSFGILMFFPFSAIYLASEIGIIILDANNILIISGILLALDIALFFQHNHFPQRGNIDKMEIAEPKE